MNESTINDDLYQLVFNTDLSNELESRLKILSNINDTLTYLHKRGEQQLTLLMLAALYGKDDMVRVMLSLSSNVKSLVEISGNVFRINGTLVKNVTALWCACDRTHYKVAYTLIQIGGATVDCGPRYPLLIDATIIGRIDTVEFLIENNYVDINTTTYNHNYKLNPIIMGVIYGHKNIVEYLIRKGAQFDYTTPVSSNTPLGYAAIKGRLEIVELLCSAGARTNKKNKNGQTPIMLAAKNHHLDIVDYLLDKSDIETNLKQLELIASSFIISISSHLTIRRVQYERMFNLMYTILAKRRIKNLKKSVAQPIAAYKFHKECETIEELNKIQNDHEHLHLDALVIRERLLVPENDDSLFKPLLIYGDELVERKQYEHCLHLWKHTFYLYQNMKLETGLHRFVWLFCKMISANSFIPIEQFVDICRLTFQPSQQIQADDHIKNSLCLLAITMKILEQSTLNHQDRQLIYQWIDDFCQQNRLTSQRQTLLHLCVDKQTYSDINYRPADVKPIINFPNISIIQLLINRYSRWIDIDAMESTSGNTALHISCQNDSISVVQLLINAGAHVDCINKFNKISFDLTQSNEIRTLLKSKTSPFRLKCLCARFIVEKRFPYQSIWPVETDMNKFLFLHGGLTVFS